MSPQRLQVFDGKGEPALEIAFVTKFDKVWDDRGSRAAKNFSCWSPAIPMDLWNEGFRALGHYGKEGHDAPETPMVIARALQRNALARPDGWEWIWDDAGSGADRDVSVWTPKAPSGYRALGAFTWGRHCSAEELARDLPDWPMACVRSDLVFRAEAGNLVWNDAGSGARHDLSVWSTNPLNPPPDSNQAYLTSGSFCPTASGDKPGNSPVAYALTIQFPEEQSAKWVPPVLTSMVSPDDTIVARDQSGNLVPASKVYIPCIQVKDPMYRGNLSQQVEETPFYTIEKYIVFKKASFNSNSGKAPGQFSFEHTTGISRTDSTKIEATVGMSMTTGYGVEAGGDAYGGKVTASFSMTVSYSLGISSEVSRTLSEENKYTRSYEIPANGAGCLFVVSYLYKFKRADGSELQSWTINSTDTHYATYPPS